MISSVLLKEWLKLKYFFTGVLVLNIGVCLKIYFEIRGLILSEHPEMIWYEAIHLHNIFFRDIMFFPLATGLILAAAQLVPEISRRRMRISLHLPLHRDLLLVLSVAAGLLFFLVAAGIPAVFIYFTMRAWFPYEISLTVFTTMGPWVLAGILGYLGGIAVLLEPLKTRKVFLAIVFSVIISVMYTGVGYGWLSPAMPYLAWLAPLFLLCVFSSGHRFQQRGA